MGADEASAGELTSAAAEELELGATSSSASPIQLLPPDAIHNIADRLALLEVLACRAVCLLFRDALSSLPFLSSLPPLRLLALRQPRAAAHPHPCLHALDTSRLRWLRIPLSFLPFPYSYPVTASPSRLYLWVDTCTDTKSHLKSLAVCNPLTGSHRQLPPLGSAWSRHGTVLAGHDGAVLIVTELAALLYAQGPDRWLNFPLNLPSKPRSPILMAGVVFVLCDVGTPWRSQWKLFSCKISDLGSAGVWAPVDRHEWGELSDILKRPRLLAGAAGGRLLMVGGLRSSFTVDAPCSTVLILRLDLSTMEWDEAGRMPMKMYRCFRGGVSGPVVAAAEAAIGISNKVKVFGGGGNVWFSGKRARGKLAMWQEDDVRKGGGGLWSWVDGIPGCKEGMYRGFMFEAGFTAAY